MSENRDTDPSSTPHVSSSSSSSSIPKLLKNNESSQNKSISNTNDSMSSKPDWKTFTNQIKKGQDQLKAGIRQGVQRTNAWLASMEEIWYHNPKVVQVQNNIQTTLHTIVTAYEHRHEYGPVLIGTTALTTGGITAFRRGRWPGIVAALVSSTVAYGFVYGLELPPPSTSTTNPTISKEE